MNTSIHNELHNLQNLIDRSQTVSFDVYDTALLRNVLYPVDIFEIVQRKLVDSDHYIEDFKKLRIKAEENARIASKKEDISIKDIYNELLALNPNLNIEDLIKCELNVETEFTVANPFIKHIYDYALSKGKKVLFISDMYLPQTFISEILQNQGYHDVKVYVSNEYGLCKGSGNLFKFVQSEEQINKETWLHIGDNYISDYKVALSQGINAFHYVAVRDRSNIKSSSCSLAYSIMKAIQLNLAETSLSIGYWEKFGITKVSSIFWGFTNWLIKSLRDRQQNNIFFLSRDGFITYEVYKKIASQIAGLPPAKYLYASRRVYQFPDILNMKREDALDVLTAFNPALGQKLRISEVFSNIGLNQSEHGYLLQQYGYNSFEDEIKDDRDRERVKKMLDKIYPTIQEIFRKEKQTLLKYLEQQGTFDFDEINIVDIGWRGSTHKAIQNLTSKKVTGYYFGTSDIVYPEIRKHVESYAFHLGSPSEIRRSIMDNVMMYELIFSAPHGSLIKLQEKDGQIIPVTKETEDVSEYFLSMYKGIMDVVELYLRYYPYISIIQREDCLKDYISFIDEKNYEDLLQFKNIYSSVGIGDTRDFQQFVTSVSLKDYKKNKSKIRIDASRNLWKNAVIVYGTINDLDSMKSLPKVKEFERFRWFLRERVLRGIKNPKKAYKYLLRKLRK